MGISQTATAVMVFLTGLLPASCHKNQPAPKAASSIVITTTNAANTANTVSVEKFDGQLGEVTLTNQRETCLQLPNGSSCTFEPKILDRKNVRITLTLESKNPYGETRDFAVAQVVAKPGKPLEVAVGDLNLAFTPQIVATE
jgi:hypothetical protein